MSAVVDPTAASAWLPLNLPTTIISTALNINCKMPDNINGRAKVISLSIIVPWHISISYLFFCKFRAACIASLSSFCTFLYFRYKSKRMLNCLITLFP